MKQQYFIMIFYELGPAGKGNKLGLMFLFHVKKREQLHMNCTLKILLFGKPEQNKTFDYRLEPG